MSHTIPSYEVVIGLEVHAQLATQSKLFSTDAAAFGAAPNTYISEVTLGYPGTLPKLNKQAVEFAMRMGLACHSDITRINYFDRKNYSYPDLPKGYQITQHRTPICNGGYITVYGPGIKSKSFQLHHIHLEEDAGKSIHDQDTHFSFIDLNRAGVPLIEIVTEPVFHTGDDVVVFLAELRKLVRYLGICDGNMEEGSLRCDVNISLHKPGEPFGKKVEIKNLNSFKHIQSAIDFETERQTSLLTAGQSILSETRLFDVATGTTLAMRSKEEVNDYRYFPEPDLSPVVIDDAWLKQVQHDLPVLPHTLYIRFIETYGLPEYDAALLTESRELAQYFETVCNHTSNFKATSNWLIGPVKAFLNESSQTIQQFSVLPATLAELINMVDAGKISYTAAVKFVFPELLSGNDSPEQIAQAMNLLQESNVEQLLPIIDSIFQDFPDKIVEYKKGKKGILGMFMGELMKRSNGKADPRVANELLEKKLQEV